MVGTQVLGSTKQLFVRCQLDNVWGTNARYWVQFLVGGEGMFILRAIDHSGQDTSGADTLMTQGEFEFFTDGEDATSSSMSSEEVAATVRQALQAPGLAPPLTGLTGQGNVNKVQLSYWLHTDLDSWSQRWSSRKSSYTGHSSSTISTLDEVVETSTETEESLDAPSLEFRSYNFGGGTVEQSLGPARYAIELQEGEKHEQFLRSLFGLPTSESFIQSELLLVCWRAAATQYTPLGLLAAAIDAAEPNNEDAFIVDSSNVERLVGQWPLCELLEVVD
jgi:hypothetical protein